MTNRICHKNLLFKMVIFKSHIIQEIKSNSFVIFLRNDKILKSNKSIVMVRILTNNLINNN